MNVELLKEFCEKILENEEYFDIQNKLSNLRSSLESLAANPQDQSQQTNVSKTLLELQNTIQSLDNEFSPKERKKFDEINAKNFFNSDFVNEIKIKISENSLSPAVVRDYVNGFTKQRQQYIETLKNLISNLEKIGIEIDDLTENETQIGFQIPRDMFHNNLDGLISELNAIKRIVRTFSEVTTGKVEEIKVGQISTSDPLIFLAQSAPIALAIAQTVNWILAKWKEVEEIRQLRAQTEQIKQFTKKEIEKFFDEKVKKIVDAGIKEKVQEILKDNTSDKGRKNELETALSDALNSLFARVERGMTIEIRMLPLEEDEEDENTDDSIENTEEFSALKELQDLQVTLKFPEPNTSPILKISEASTKEKNP